MQRTVGLVLCVVAAAPLQAQMSTPAPLPLPIVTAAPTVRSAPTPEPYVPPIKGPPPPVQPPVAATVSPQAPSGTQTVALTICNKRARDISVAVAYPADAGETTQGWWTVPAGAACRLIGTFPLRQSRFGIGGASGGALLTLGSTAYCVDRAVPFRLTNAFRQGAAECPPGYARAWFATYAAAMFDESTRSQLRFTYVFYP